ncbi:hypothetical protein ACFQ49_07975 [Kroppenstedtia eburnea]|uniref:hypothetical protein n=1 Tax=Kroppenstedtia eburnea TaxID=714067 RepID=UPI00362F0163
MNGKLFALLAAFAMSIVPFVAPGITSAKELTSPEGEAHIMACSGDGHVKAYTPVYKEKSVSSPVTARYGSAGMHYVRGFMFDDGWFARNGSGWIKRSDFLMFECY